jgi:primase-polymerase (primpol)-like protein
VTETRSLRWLSALGQPARAPQKAPPAGGVLEPDRWTIPQELRNHHAWATWHYAYENNRWSKPPYNPSAGEKAEPSDPATWSSFDDAYEAYHAGSIPKDGGRPYDGVSFALDLRWGIVGVDLDHISEHRLEADRIVQQLGSYTEFSPSGDGYRIFVKGTLPVGRRRRGWVEMYNQRRFLTVTGHKLPNAPATLMRSSNLYQVWNTWLERG